MHCIEESDFLFSTREKPWHGLGIVIQEAPDSKEALKIAKLDWLVEQRKIYQQTKNGMEIIPKLLGNFRSDTNHCLGVVTQKYKVIQNHEAFAFTDALLGEGVRYETAGSLDNGGRVWMLAKTDKVEILEDIIEPFLVFTHGHDGKNSVKVSMTPVRVVCNNTLNLALNTAKRSWNTIHMGNIQDKLEEAKRTLGLSQQYMIALKDKAEEMERIKISDEGVKDFINELFKINEEKMSNREKNNIQLVRNNLWSVYSTTKDIQKFRGSAWGVINAVSDLVGHAEPLRRTSTYREKNFAKIINGHPIMDNAMKLLMAA